MIIIIIIIIIIITIIVIIIITTPTTTTIIIIIIIIIIILSLRVGTSKNKNIDHRVEETCAFMSTESTYETDRISLICDSAMSSALNFGCLCVLL